MAMEKHIGTMSLIFKRVSVEPPPSALNMTLSAFAAERRRLQHGAVAHPQLSIDISCPQGAQ